MSYWACLLSLSAITLTHSADKDLGHLISKIKGNGDKVDLKLYYECLCPYSIDFYTSTLNDTVTKLGSYLNLKTYPYGNAQRAKENGKTIITCQHGPDECYGNKLHACAIAILKNVTRSVFYNSCMMSAQWGPDSPDKDAVKCGESMEIDAKPIIKCAKGKKGERLLEYYGELTDKEVPDKKGVPWILINGKVFTDDDNKFIPTICSALSHPPPQCH